MNGQSEGSKTSTTSLWSRFAANPAKCRQILASARKVFFSDGYGSATIDKIAADSTVSKATIYRYFENKQEIFAALMQLDADEAPPLVTPEGDTDVVDVLTRVGTMLITRMVDPAALEMFRLMVAESARFPELAATFEEHGPRQWHTMVAAQLQSMNDAGVLEIPDASLASGQFVGLCQAGLFLRAQLTTYTPTAEEISTVVDSAVRLFVRGYAPTTDDERSG